MSDAPPPYRGRLAPSPTGYLHLGHARTFWIAQERAAAAGGALILRSEDLDRARCRAEFRAAMLEDLRWFGLRWSEGPDVGGPHAPYTQSERMAHYTAAFEKLRARGVIYPCNCSRQDVLRALGAPHAGEDEPLYPGTCRPRRGKFEIRNPTSESESARLLSSATTNIEPLAGIYPRTALAIADECLRAGEFKLETFVRELESAQLAVILSVTEKETPLFTNWNAPEDLR